MFEISKEDLTIHITRGDAAVFSVGAFVGEDGNKQAYTFRVGDVVRFAVCGKKDYSNVVLQKDFTVNAETDAVEIVLDGEDTKIGGTISKPTEYWYEVELNPETKPQTIIGHTEDGAKVFMLYPESVKEGA
jgi:hypothetical protein